MPSSAFGSLDGPITGSQVKFAVGGLRFDREIVAGWQVTPSLGFVAGDIDRLGLAIEDLSVPVKRSIVQVMIPSIGRNFDEQGRPPWEPLAPDTVKLRGSSSPILTVSGALRRGVTQIGIWRIGKESATIQSLPSDIWYGALHQSGYGSMQGFAAAARTELGPRATARSITKRMFELLDQARGGPGTKRKPGRQRAAAVTIPQRRFLMFQEDDIDDIMQVFAEWLEDEVRSVGRFTGKSVRASWRGPDI